MTELRTPSQTVGPYFAIALPWPDGPFVVPSETPQAFWIRGHLIDGHGQPVNDGLIECWQADPEGRFATGDPATLIPTGFRGFGRAATDDEGAWQLFTVKPGIVPDDEGRPQAPHLDLLIHARGLLKHLVTRLYFADEAEANAADPLLSGLAEQDRRETLIATPSEDGYRFEIHLQGQGETIFFDV